MVEIDTSNFKNDSKNGDLTHLTFVWFLQIQQTSANCQWINVCVFPV